MAQLCAAWLSRVRRGSIRVRRGSVRVQRGSVGRGVAQLVVRRAAVCCPEFESRHGTPVGPSTGADSDEETRAELSECYEECV